MIEFFKNLSNDYLELLNDNEDFSVIIQVSESTNNKIFQAHSAILRKRSLYFRNELANINIDKNNIKTINLNHVSIKQFEIIIMYIYGGVFSLDDLDVSFIFEIMLVAYEFLLEELGKFLETLLIEEKASWLRLHFSYIYKMCFQKNKAQRLQKWCNDIVVKYPEKIFDLENFDSIPENALISLIERDDLKMDEIKIWNYIIKWGIVKNPGLSSNPKEWSPENFLALKIALQNCLPHIRYFQISGDDIINNVKPYKQIFEKNLWADIKTRLMSQNQPISSLILPPRTILPSTLPRTMQIFVKTPTDETLELDAWLSDTVKELKEKINARNNYSFHSISFKGNKLDDNSRISNIGMENGCTFYCYIQIFVKTPTDETLELDALPSDTVKELKEKIHAKTNYSFHGISFKGNKLDNSSRLFDIGTENGCTFYCCIQIFVRTTTDKTLELDALPSHTVKELKEKIHARNNCSFHGISFKGNKLDDNSRLSDIGTENGCTFYCCIQIFVRTTTDETLELDVLPSDTVKELKEKIHARSNCSFHGISFKGNKLNDSSRLSDIGMEYGCTFYCYIQIFVKTPTDETLELDALPSDTVMELKQKIHVRNNCSFHGISFKGNKLNDSNRLSDIGMENGCTFYCYIQIFVKTPTDETLELDALPSDTVKELKEKIHNCSFHDISFKGNKLDDSHKLSNIGIENGCTLHCYPKYAQIFIKTPTNETVELDVLLSNTVMELKQKIQTRVSSSINRISFEGNELVDNCRLYDAGIKSGCTLYCFIQIVFKTLTGKTFTLQASLSDTVGHVKRLIENSEHIPLDEQRLIFAGKQIMNNLKLSDYNIQNESIVHVVTRLRA